MEQPFSLRQRASMKCAEDDIQSARFFARLPECAGLCYHSHSGGERAVLQHTTSQAVPTEGWHDLGGFD